VAVLAALFVLSVLAVFRVVDWRIALAAASSSSSRYSRAISSRGATIHYC
jgi:hypothetical protein